ncbi:MAG: phosphomannomutase [Silicimonas sp.]|nr:phosphomannomutase [Silicimonas sp.]
MAPKFGTSGLRGLAVELTDDLCATYAAAFASQHANNGSLYVGQDKRESSARIAAAVARGAASQGLSIVDCGILPTPAMAGAALRAKTISIMVTGSHIPADRNGLKFYTAEGEFTKADEALLAMAMAGFETPRHVAPSVTTTNEPLEDYLARYTAGFAPDALQGQRVGVWLHSSAAGEVLPGILRALGAEVVSLGEVSGFVPVDTEAVDVETRDTLAAWVREFSLDALVSTDGDADRPLVVDDKGQVVPGDILGPITARWCRADEVVTTVSANTLVEGAKAFQRVSRTKIGSPYVIAEMEARMAAGSIRVAGYEPNGGFLLGWDVSRNGREIGALMTRDAVLPILATLAAAVEADMSVSGLVAALPTRRTATDRLENIPQEISLRLVNGILAGETSLFPTGLGQVVEIDRTDGVRLRFDSGRILHVRPSGNAPELRCYVEAESDAAAADLLQLALSNLRRAVQ